MDSYEMARQAGAFGVAEELAECKAALVEARVEIEQLKTELELEKTNGDAIMEIRASLHERFGAEVDAAFFDDVIGNALVLATRQAEAIMVKLRDELTTRRTYNPECNYCRAFVDVLDSLRADLSASPELKEVNHVA